LPHPRKWPLAALIVGLATLFCAIYAPEMSRGFVKDDFQ